MLTGVLVVQTLIDWWFICYLVSGRLLLCLQHADRQFHSPTGEVTKRESSIWLKPFDHVGVSLMQKEVPDLFVDAKSVVCEGNYCGRPYLYPILSLLDARWVTLSLLHCVSA